MRLRPSEVQELTVVGGGLAGCEAAWQAAERGVRVSLIEMRPERQTPAHGSDRLAELVCSNSFGSQSVVKAAGLLQAELRRMGSLLLSVAEEVAVPAGHALAVDREAFAGAVTREIERHPLISVARREATSVPAELAVLATGPLTSDALAEDLGRCTDRANLYFFDALAPIVTAESIDMTVAFRQSRYDRGQTEAGDYINCPLDRQEFESFASALRAAERIPLRSFELEDRRFFEGCLPIEIIAERGDRALAFGPLRPVGLTDPRTGKRPYAVVQLRQDDAAATLYNLVGLQTNLRWAAQEEVLRLVPGLGHAEFVRFGQMHRNTFLNAPAVLNPDMTLKARPHVYVGGQLSGVEGYAGNIASGLVVGMNAARRIRGLGPRALPPTTMTGALLAYLTKADPERFQPMKANLGLLPSLEKPVRSKRERYRAYSVRAQTALEEFLSREDDPALVEPSRP